MTRQRWIFVAGLVVAAMAAGLVTFTPLGDRLRSLLTRQDSTTATVSPPADTAGAMPAASAPMPAGTARGDVMVDTRRQQLIGVRTEAVSRGPIAQEIRAVGLVRYDETRQAEVNTKIDGWIRDLYADYTGKAVRAGDPLFTLYSPELLTTQNEYLLARRGHTQAEHAEVGAVRHYSDRLLQAARERLLLWDLGADDVEELEQAGKATGIVAFRSPVGGVLVEKAAVKGMRVMAGQMLFRIADLSTVWVEADVYERDLGQVRIGQTAAVTFDAYPGESFGGRTTYIHPSVNEATRTASVRIQIPNRGGRLRPGMYANVQIQGASSPALTVTANALLDAGTEQLVFVAQGDGYFTPQPVRIGRRLGGRVEILEGLTEGERVAAGATFFLDSESQLRAGTQNYEAPPAMSGGATAGPSLDISFRALQDPPKTGENIFEVALKDPSGMPVTGAAVSVRFFMPAMPTMNMPAMENDATLPHVGGGVYRGPGHVIMGGRWDVTVTARRGDQQLGRKQFAIVAR
jgi:Cu(I)/Ag(I) efflux system membrane fusion protein/cobalt-zinc-cadmium efflux system membrane fusion protein